MTELHVETLTKPGARLGEENPLPRKVEALYPPLRRIDFRSINPQ